MNKLDITSLEALNFVMIEHCLDDLYWKFQWSKDNIVLTFSFSLVSCSVQTLLYVDNNNLNKISSEGLRDIEIKENIIMVTFDIDGIEVKLSITIGRTPHIEWIVLKI